jgi:NTE family protein
MFDSLRKKSNSGMVQINSKVKIGLALGGGGARGIGHIGALKAFEELGVKFDFISGTSAGSVVGALYAFGKSANEIEELAKNLKRKDITKSFIPFLKPAKSEGLEELINQAFGDLTVFSEMKIPFCAVCTDLKTGKEVDFDYGNVAKVVSGSCAVPGIFSPVVYENMHLVDGGLRNNVPADVVKKMGANVVFAIDVNHLRGTGTDSLSTISVLSSTLGIMMQAKVDKAMECADMIFEPALETFSPLKFENVDEMIKIGYDTVMSNKDKIQKMLGLNPKKISKYFTKTSR